MEWPVLISSLSVALLFVVPLGIKWQIKTRYTLTGAIAIGGATGVLWSWDWLRGVSDNVFIILALELTTIILLSLITVMFTFYHDPARVPPKKAGIIVSPADGEVLYIKTTTEGDAPVAIKGRKMFRLEELAKTKLDDENYLIGIGMNLLNVHVNRAPIPGKVELLKHIKGDFHSLKIKEAILTNERFTTIISNGKFKVAVVQIASRLVRKIVSYLEEGEAVKIGQRIGMIKFGSQVDLIIPKFEGLRLKVNLGDQVIAGISVIAEFDEFP